jgi:hypothetical protein
LAFCQVLIFGLLSGYEILLFLFGRVEIYFAFAHCRQCMLQNAGVYAPWRADRFIARGRLFAIPSIGQ